MEYGQVSNIEVYHEGKLVDEKAGHVFHTKVKSRLDVINEVMNAIELIESKQTSKLVLTISADPKDFSFRLFTKDYVTKKTR